MLTKHNKSLFFSSLFSTESPPSANCPFISSACFTGINSEIHFYLSNSKIQRSYKIELRVGMCVFSNQSENIMFQADNTTGVVCVCVCVTYVSVQNLWLLIFPIFGRRYFFSPSLMFFHEQFSFWSMLEFQRLYFFIVKRENQPTAAKPNGINLFKYKTRPYFY